MPSAALENVGRMALREARPEKRRPAIGDHRGGGFPGSSVVKNLPANAGNMGSIAG